MKFFSKIGFERFWGWCLDRVNDNLNIRVIKFGSRYQHGIPYKDLKKRYCDRNEDWVAIERMLGDALYNFDNNGSRITPFVVLKKIEPHAIDTCIYALSYEASFSYLSYRTAVITLMSSAVAVVISFVAVIVTIW